MLNICNTFLTLSLNMLYFAPEDTNDYNHQNRSSTNRRIRWDIRDHFEDKVTIPQDEHGFDIENGVAYISRGKFERFRKYYQFTVDGVESVIDMDEVREIIIVS